MCSSPSPQIQYTKWLQTMWLQKKAVVTQQLNMHCCKEQLTKVIFIPCWTTGQLFCSKGCSVIAIAVHIWTSSCSELQALVKHKLYLSWSPTGKCGGASHLNIRGQEVIVVTLLWMCGGSLSCFRNIWFVFK